MGDRQGELYALDGLGYAYRKLGEPRRAIEFHEQALAIAREIGHRFSEADALTGLGNAYKNLGALDLAAEHEEQALAIAREINKTAEVASLSTPPSTLKAYVRADRAARRRGRAARTA
jgi:tetratricopeptide (TPR) repeat protein